MDLIIDSLGEELVARRLLGVAGRVVDMRAPMRELLDRLRQVERRQFDSQGAYGSGGWQALAPSTVAKKGNDRILVDSGALYAAMTGETGDSISVALPDGLDFGTTLPYAVYHQQGRGVPQRRVAQLPDVVRRDMVRILQRSVMEETR